MSGVPTLSAVDAIALAARVYGRTVTATPLPSERDQNWLLTDAGGARTILKIANAMESIDILAAECTLLEHLVHTGLTPTLIRAGDGSVMVRDGAHFVRLISAMPGRTLGTVPLQTDALRRDVGRALGVMDTSLTGCTVPAFDREFHWDLAHASRVVHAHVGQVADAALRACINTCLTYHDANVVPMLPTLRRSLIHSDANDFNVLVDASSQRVTGIIDFGDAVVSQTVNNVAIAMAYVALSAEEPLPASAAVLAGYHETHPLTEPEIAALFSLMRIRLCVSACMAVHQQAARPDDAYLGISQAPIRRVLPMLVATHPRLAHYTFRAACGLPAVPAAPIVTAYLTRQADHIAPLLGVDLRTAPVAPLDFSVGSPLISNQHAENAPAELDQRVARVLADHHATFGVGGYGEARVIYHWPNEPRAPEPRTIHIGLDISAAPGTPLYAPLDGVVHGFVNASGYHDYGPLIVLQHETDDATPVPFFTLYGHLSLDSLDGLQHGQVIRKGDEFARIGSAPTNGDWWAHVHVQLITDMLDVPCNVDGAARASERQVWQSLCLDPNLLLHIPASRLPARTSKKEIADARRRHIGGNLSVSYGANPLNIVRGSGQYLYDENGHRFIDAYNNVAHVGHAHPRVARAVSEQLALLNTNTRYLQDQLTAYANDLTSLLPAGLDVAFFTASGSEANELALRLTRAATGTRDLLVMDSAYHGHTTTLIDISPYKHNGPGGHGAPDWVHVTPVPDVYRTRDIEGDPGAYFARQVGHAIDRIAGSGRRLSGYIAETCPSVGGQIMLPLGYLRDVYDRVRAAGGLCIADEVQTGFGRLGTHFWAFEAHDVVPDIVVLGKPIANGYPMGAVITTRAIADAFNNGMEYFSTFGGSTAACVAAHTTLRVTLDEQLQANALRVGSHLLADLRSLMAQHELIGDVRGSGLFLGVELVRNRVTRDPADTEASFVVNRMRARGVLAGTDGPFHNVIKLRGPMPLTVPDAERIVENMQLALAEMPD
jgi:4-aminobutyrate aminotransferase-like enzyme/Ser/Thr protein kinase RdoA (MazF antagonist)